MKKLIRKDLNNHAKEFRTKVLKITLKEMEELTGVNLKTLSAFENSRSHNSRIYAKYIQVANKTEHWREFLDTMSGGYENE